MLYVKCFIILLFSYFSYVYHFLKLSIMLHDLNKLHLNMINMYLCNVLQALEKMD